jgi:hypothetical protein
MYGRGDPGIFRPSKLFICGPLDGGGSSDNSEGGNERWHVQLRGLPRVALEARRGSCTCYTRGTKMSW